MAHANKGNRGQLAKGRKKREREKEKTHWVASSLKGQSRPSLTWSVLRRVQVAKDVAGRHGRHLIWG
ncbi:hypothetical protein E2C01_013555 [Portunus trituberculatus]|uniref:Uncharacterized protein n=1 Tax=Portunus trituberculatus TaxID=210409 RepID=A0A5B7DHG6_PORTR|nr:hypothetical protein [Portunus trituberculatus]